MEPFDTLRDSLPGWTLAITALEGVMGFCDTERRTIWVDVNLPRREMRSTMMHEMIHAERGDRSDDPQDEYDVQVETAKRLIPNRALLAAMASSTHPEDLADILDVDPDVLRTRMHNLDTDLRHVVGRLLAEAIPRDPASPHSAIHRWWLHYDQPGQPPAGKATQRRDATVLSFPLYDDEPGLETAHTGQGSA